MQKPTLLGVGLIEHMHGQEYYIYVMPLDVAKDYLDKNNNHFLLTFIS